MSQPQLAQYPLSGCFVGSSQFQRGEVTFFESRLAITLRDDDGGCTSELLLNYDDLSGFRVRVNIATIRIECPFSIVVNWAALNGFSLESSQEDFVSIVTVLNPDTMHHFSTFIVPILTQAHHERSCSRVSAGSVAPQAAAPVSPTKQLSHSMEREASSLQSPWHHARQSSAEQCPSHSHTPSENSLDKTAAALPPPSPIQKVDSSPLDRSSIPPQPAASEKKSSDDKKNKKKKVVIRERDDGDDNDEDNVTVGDLLKQKSKQPRVERPTESGGAAYDFSVELTGEREKQSSKAKKAPIPAPSPLYFKKRDPAPAAALKAPPKMITKKEAPKAKSAKKEEAKPVKKTMPPSIISAPAAPIAAAPSPRMVAVAAAAPPLPEASVRSPTFLHRPDAVVMPTPRHTATGHAAAHANAKLGRDDERKQMVQLKTIIDGGLDEDNLQNLVKQVAILAKAQREAKAKQEKSRLKLDGSEVARCVSQLLSRFTQESQARRHQVQVYYNKRYDDTIAGIMCYKEALGTMQEELTKVTATVEKSLESLTYIKERMQLDMQRWDTAELMDCTAATASIQQKLLMIHSE